MYIYRKQNKARTNRTQPEQTVQDNGLYEYLDIHRYMTINTPPERQSQSQSYMEPTANQTHESDAAKGQPDQPENAHPFVQSRVSSIYAEPYQPDSHADYEEIGNGSWGAQGFELRPMSDESPNSSIYADA